MSEAGEAFDPLHGISRGDAQRARSGKRGRSILPIVAPGQALDFCQIKDAALRVIDIVDELAFDNIDAAWRCGFQPRSG